jgi:hypothetical protein
MRHVWQMRGLAALVLLFGFVLHSMEALLSLAPFIVGLFAGAAFCERVTGALLRGGENMSLLTESCFARNLVRMHSTFLPLTAAGAIVYMWIDSRPVWGMGRGTGSVVLLASFAWWWLNLARSFHARMPPAESRIGLILGPPLVAVFSILVGCCAGGISAIFMFMFLGVLGA